MSSLPSTVYPHQLAQTRSESLFDKLAFLCFAGFILTQAYAIPLTALSVNWAIWPSLPDLFGVGMILGVILSKRAGRVAEFNRVILKCMGILVLYNFYSFSLLILSRASLDESIKYPAFAVFMWLKFFLISLAAAHIPLDRKRTSVLHWAALIAFLWLTLSAIASYFGFMDLKRFVSHLPSELSGKWSSQTLASTAWDTPGPSSIVVLVLAGLILNTFDYRKKILLPIIVIALGAIMVFFSGSRQGVVRFATFILLLLARGARKKFIELIGFILAALFFFEVWGRFTLSETKQIQWAFSRQRYLTQETFTDEGMTGRPTLWTESIDILTKYPGIIIWGYTVNSLITSTIPKGSMISPHNMILHLLLKGGLIALLIYVFCYGSIFVRLWRIRNQAWPMVAVSAAMLVSSITSTIFEPGLGTGWYLGLYFVCLHIAANLPTPPNRK